MIDPIDLTDGGGRDFGIRNTESYRPPMTADESGPTGGLEPVDESDFELETGRFRGETGNFVVGSPPPDYDAGPNRFRAEDGQFKDRSADLYDEMNERRFDDLSFEG